MRLLSLLLLLSACRTGVAELKIDTGGADTGVADTGLIDADQDGYKEDVDCDDQDATVHPDADEICDGLDNNCDGVVDLDAIDQSDFHPDTDGDGYGDPYTTTSMCGPNNGYTDDATDCDDTDGAIHPDADEICDGIDNDCDGAIDDQDPDVTDQPTWYFDYDQDGFGDDGLSALGCEAPTAMYISDGGDCSDIDANIYPGAPEGCDGGDYNCDGLLDSDADGDGYADAACGGDDCDDSDASVLPEVGGGCALGTTCLDVQNNGYDVGDGIYTVDPDGYGTGLDPFDVTCDMSTDGGGWTEISYADDLPFQQHFSGGDKWQSLPTDFTFALSDEEIEAISALSTDGYQEYVGLCEHVIHHLYAPGGSYSDAFGFTFFDGKETSYGTASYSPYDITVSQDGCSGNGGEGGTLANATIFIMKSSLLPIRNVTCIDCGNSTEQFGSPLTTNPAWLR
jgi:hypothetical protein